MELSARENLLRVIRHEDPQWVPNGLESVVTIRPPVTERPAEAGKDSWGVSWEYEEGARGGTHPAHGDYPVTDLSRWEKEVAFPNVDHLPWNQLPRTETNRDNSLLCGFIHFGLFERSYLLLGMENALVGYMTETSLMAAFVGAIADYKIALIQRMDDVLHLDMVYFGDDWGTQQQLFMPPEVWRSTIGKHTRRIYDAIKDRGILINQHSCGKIEEVFGEMVDMGADIWNPSQPCNDLAALKREFGGRITFCGGIDSQFVLDRPEVTPDEVRAEVRLRIDQMGAGGGYIAAPSHGIPYREEVVHAMEDEIATYGRACYR